MFLLRSRFRAIISSKQSRMDHTTQTSSPEQNQSTPFSSFLGSPLFFGGFLSKTISDEISASPTSILDTKQFCNSINHPFVGYHENVFKPSSPISKSADIKDPYHEQKGIGLVLEKEDFDSFSIPNSKMVIFGANLMKVKVPPFSAHSNVISTLESPGDYGIKTKNSQLLRSLSINSPCVRGKLEDQEGLSLMEMEMSEEYTCVMTHGPNPKTTHIFDDTIVETNCLYGGVGNLSDLKNENNVATKGDATSLPMDFLGFCYTCKVKLDNAKDIYIYRGEKGFCSSECRLKEMVMEEEGQAKIFNLDEDYS